MNGTGYRIAFERLKEQVLVAGRANDIEGLERARGEMDALVASLVTDPRRLRALAGSSTVVATEVERHAAGLDIPRFVLDPLHDGAYARLWLAWLDDERLQLLERVLADEVHRRRRNSAPMAQRPRRPSSSAAALARLFG